MIANEALCFLLVDDDADDVSLFEETIAEVAPGVQLSVAGNGLEALRLLREGKPKPHLVFMDLNMPRMGGKECLREIKADPELSAIPVLIYSTSSQVRDMEETMQGGAVCFITKPSTIRDLKTIVASLAGGLPHNLQAALHSLRDQTDTFVAC